MKKIMVLLTVFAFIASFTTPLLAADMPKPMEKLKDGVTAVLNAPFEVPDHTAKEIDNHEVKVVGFLDGLLKGTNHMIKKGAAGIIDVATFPIDAK